jgi:hypothetical protein
VNSDLDVQVVEETSVDSETSQMHLIAKMAAKILGEHYVNHVWAVGWAPGMTLIVKNLAIDDGRYGFTIDAAKAATISELEKNIIWAGGELLERCGVPRGAWNGEMMTLQDKVT